MILPFFVGGFTFFCRWLNSILQVLELSRTLDLCIIFFISTLKHNLLCRDLGRWRLAVWSSGALRLSCPRDSSEISNWQFVFARDRRNAAVGPMAKTGKQSLLNIECSSSYQSRRPNLILLKFFCRWFYTFFVGGFTFFCRFCRYLNCLEHWIFALYSLYLRRARS